MAAVLGRYQVLKHLTTGGMAEVLLGRSDGIEGFERHVVLKRIRPEHARDKRFISMFLDEARLAAGLHHQAIVQVFDIGESNGEYFFAMEYIHGEDLRKLLASVWKGKTHVPLGHVCAIVSAVAAGLHYAHERRDSKGRPLGIVHRDVSPSNVLIGYDGAVKVLDFGIAKAAMRQAETAVRSLKGKTSYMSPEQCKGDAVDRRSDVYGLGVLLYELATTSRLFKGDNEYLVMDAIVNGKIAMPRVRRPDLPNELSSIIMRALATDPARRYQTADELRIDIDQFATNHDLTGSTAALATYMRKLFGERPEPWLDDDAEISIQEAGQSWSEEAEVPGRLSDNTLARRSSRSSLQNIVAAAGTASRMSSSSPYETTPSLKFGWESRPLQSARANKLLWATVPVLALVAFGLWKFGLSKHTTHEAAAPAAAPVAAAAAPAPAAAPTPAPTPAPAAPAIEAPASAPAAAPTEPPVFTPPSDTATKKPAKAKKAEHTETVATSTAPAPSAPASTAATAPAAIAPAATAPAPAPAAPTPSVAPAPVAAAPAPVAQPPAAPAITAAPAPKELEPQIATLSNATVSAIASDHSAQLAKCEGGTTLHGDVAVSFQIDGTGKVVKSQLASTIKNPKIAGCILRAVQSWKFPRPPSGAAKGVYSISYQ